MSNILEVCIEGVILFDITILFCVDYTALELVARSGGWRLGFSLSCGWQLSLPSNSTDLTSEFHAFIAGRPRPPSYQAPPAVDSPTLNDCRFAANYTTAMGMQVILGNS